MRIERESRRERRTNGLMRRAASSGLALAALASGLLPASGGAVEFFEGRIQLHGFAEAQLRAIARNYDPSDGLDLTQWYTVGNVELEFDIAPDGFGPINLMSAYVRAEARYDCVWTGACGLFPSVNTYGNDAERLPTRLSDARRNGLVGSIDPSFVRVDPDSPTLFPVHDFSDKRPRIRTPLGQSTSPWGVGEFVRPVLDPRATAPLWNFPGLAELFFTVPGLDPGSVDQNGFPVGDPLFFDDDISGCIPGSPSPRACRYPGAYVSLDYIDYRFGLSETPGAFGGNGTRIWGPWRPKDVIVPIGAIRDRVNPYNAADVHPVMRDENGLPVVGQAPLPFRPAALVNADANGNGVIDPYDDVGPLVSRGLYYPSTALIAALADPRFGAPDTNFSQDELAWNRGAAQSQTFELKEAYVDVEVADSALWIRGGRQTIVWGKTELFRSQDQFNAQDLGLASLPTLEESRIPSWALRAIYSFYDVGPFEDVRLEGAMIFDRFQPVDLGRCGEPYAPPQSCLRSAGLFAHGLTGTTLAGEWRPEDPWDAADAIEFGLRVEWRWQRFSFSLSNFHGYSDVPHTEQISVYERNVDLYTGRPRRSGLHGRCVFGTEVSCLGRAVAGQDPTDPASSTFPLLARPRVNDVLLNHPANQQLFATICASTVGATQSLPANCAFNLWNSQELALQSGVSPTAAQGFTAILAGHGRRERVAAGENPFLVDINGKFVLLSLARFESDAPSPPLLGVTYADLMPLVPIHFNTNFNADGGQIDGGFLTPARRAAFPGQSATGLWARTTISPALTVQQEALLGCGDFWGTDCDIYGFDILNAEASALYQSWPGVEGTNGFDWDTLSGARPQPGTINFRGGPVCTYYDQATFGLVKLPGCRGAKSYVIDNTNSLVLVTFDRFYDPEVDGCVFAPTIGSSTVLGFTPSGVGIDLSTCAPNLSSPNGSAGRIIRTLYHPFAGCLTPAEEAANLKCNLGTAPAAGYGAPRDYDAEFLGLVPGRSAQVFNSEVAAVSWNLMMALAGTSLPQDVVGGGAVPPCDPGPADEPDTCSDRAARLAELDVNDPQRRGGCSFRKPFLCRNVGAFFAVSGQQRNTMRAGGNGVFGRRDFLWHGGSVVGLAYAKRNVLGFSTDFAEDRTKTNWGLEFTWFDNVVFSDNDSPEGVTNAQAYNLSISVDRPTFIRFLNPARTFFFNSQVFLQYIDGFRGSFLANGPFNATMTFAVSTGYQQDRLLPSLVVAHNFNSISGAVIANLTYRFTQSFSVQVGLANFYGRVEDRVAALVPVGAPSAGAGLGSQRSYVENGLSSVRDRDEVFLRLRYTF